jgi:large subunit ribosomal protein L35
VGLRIKIGSDVAYSGKNTKFAPPTIDQYSEAMPKMKTKSGAKKRFSLTGTGKVKRKHANHNHILTKKHKKRKRNLQKTTLVAKVDQKGILALLK